MQDNRSNKQIPSGGQVALLLGKMVLEGKYMAEESKLEKRGRSMAAIGMVERVGDKFKVSTPSLRGKQTHYWVMRNQSGKVVCECLEFQEEIKNDETFRCEHIFAVKFALLAKATEPSRNKKRYYIAEQSFGMKDTFIDLEYNNTIYRDVVTVSSVIRNSDEVAMRIVNFLNGEQI